MRSFQVAVLPAMLLVVLSVTAVDVFAEEQTVPAAAPAVAYSRSLAIQPGELSGTVLYPDGKTPAAEAAVRVWNVAKGEFGAQTRADKQGHYRLTDLALGRYLVVFGDRVSVDLTVDAKAELIGGPLNVIIPRGRSLFAQMSSERQAAVLAVLGATDGEPADGGDAAGEELAAGTPLRTVLIVGGGTATAIGTVLVLNHDGGDHGVVSP